MAEARMPQKSIPKVNKVDQGFWEGAANDKFLLQKCKSCGKVQFFPRVACVDCFGELDWIESKGTGKIHSFTLVRVPRNPAFKDEVPIYYINVILDEGVIVESKLIGDNKEKVKMGDRVKAVFQQTHDPAIKLPCFALAG
ncbi:MAG TPA: Zn-ribbon domain-containing OB-fold protein [Candidatus Binatia bacterium]|nr:Zn-ribbon domain-containing OB-fold protein [Candidatus Binatia bacterium]